MKTFLNRHTMACWAVLLELIWSIASTAAPTILASGVGSPDNIIVDNSTVYWGDAFTGQISSVSKNPGGGVTNYSINMDPGGDLVQDNASLYFIGAAWEPGANGVEGHPIYKMSKTGGLAARIGNHNAWLRPSRVVVRTPSL